MQATISVPTWARHVISDLTDMDRSPHRVDRRRVASFTLDLPDDVYFEYAFLDDDGRIRGDPENPDRGSNPWYPEVSVLTGPSYRPDPLARPPEPATPGELTRHRVESRRLGQLRRVSVHTPAGASGPLPVVLVQDGTAFLRVGKLGQLLDVLVARGEARPAHLVFVEPVDRRAEYGFGADYRGFLLDELLPVLRDEHAVADETMLLGVSLGGLLSMTVALEHPERVAAVGSLSGAFLGSPDDRDFYGASHSWVARELARRDAVPWRAYTDTGTIEWLTDVNRRVAELLAERAPAHAFAERNAGHNWTNWRNGSPAALRFLLAP